MDLSVSSNGSTWVKHRVPACDLRCRRDPFSILERIDVGETILHKAPPDYRRQPFSILERIDVGETNRINLTDKRQQDFQYPRTDRRG